MSCVFVFVFVFVYVFSIVIVIPGGLWIVCDISFQKIYGLIGHAMIYEAVEVIWIFLADGWTGGRESKVL